MMILNKTSSLSNTSSKAVPFAIRILVVPIHPYPTLAVTLGYLRGLEIPALRLEDMPRL